MARKTEAKNTGKTGRPRRASASDVARRLRYDPLKALIKAANSRLTEPEEKVRINLALMPYCYPKLRPVDEKGEAAPIALRFEIGLEDD